MAMARTQVYFEPEVLDYLKQEAARKNKTLAYIIRTKVEAQTPVIKKIKKAKKTKKMSGADFLLKMAKEAEELGFEGPKDLASNMDKYLYGTD